MSEIIKNGNLFLLYFCYGSNLCSKRIHINIKSAEKYGNGLLKDWIFTFASHSKLWAGSTANIVPKVNEIVWGTVWTISPQELERLDKQEVGYKRIEINVLLNGTEQVVKCYTYVQKEVVPDPDFTVDQSIHTPSLIYKSVIIKGAVEQQLPEDYIEFLKSFPDNGISKGGPQDLNVDI